MKDEIILRNNMRPIGIALCSIGLAGAVGFVLFSLFNTHATQKAGETFLACLFGTIGIFAFTYQIFFLNSQKVFLETSSDGIMLNGFLQKYIPWENIQDINIKQLPKNNGVDHNLIHHPQAPSIYIKIRDPKNIYFDSLIRFFLQHKQNFFLARLSESGNIINLHFELASTESHYELCRLLKERLLESRQST